MTTQHREKRRPDTQRWWQKRWWKSPLLALGRVKTRLFNGTRRTEARVKDNAKIKRSGGRAVRPNPSASWALVALRQRVMVGVVSDKYRLYGSGKVRKLE